MKITNVIVICLAILFTSCEDETSPEVVASNRYNLASPGFKVGTFEDGSELQRWTIGRGESNHSHYVYRVIAKKPQVSPDTTTINYQVPMGKTTRTEAIVLVDGVEYVPRIEKSE